MDGTRLWYRISGAADAPCVVLTDGIFCEGFVWKYLRPALEPRWRVLHWNLRGHGRSTRPASLARVTIADHASDLVHVLDACGVTEPAVLAGHSMGTQVSLEVCREHRDRVRGLVLLCGSYGRVTETFKGTDLLARALPVLRQWVGRQPLLSRIALAALPPSLAMDIALRTGELDARRLIRDDMAGYFEHIASMDPEVALATLEAAGRHDARDLLPDLHVPALVVAAENDTFTPPALALAMARLLPHARYLEVPDGSHACPIEQPGTVNAAVLSFLDSL